MRHSLLNRKVLQESDAEALNAMMDSGFSFADASHILETPRNREVFAEIRSRLERGEMLGSFIGGFMPAAYARYLPELLKFLSVPESLALTREMIERQKQETGKLVRALLYPCLLLSGMSAGLLLFNRTVLPSMLSLLRSFHEESGGIVIVQTAAEIFSVVLFLVMVLTGAACLFFLSRRRVVATYCFFAEHRSGGLLVQYASRQFAGIYLQCIRRRISTRESIAIMKEMKEKPLTAFIAAELEKSFLEGKAFEKAVCSPYLEAGLAGFFRMALYTDNTEQMLKGYLAMCEKRTEAQIRRLTVVIQLFCYGAVGAVIVAVYRILMMPMSLLQSLG